MISNPITAFLNVTSQSVFARQSYRPRVSCQLVLSGAQLRALQILEVE